MYNARDWTFLIGIGTAVITSCSIQIEDSRSRFKSKQSLDKYRVEYECYVCKNNLGKEDCVDILRAHFRLTLAVLLRFRVKVTFIRVVHTINNMQLHQMLVNRCVQRKVYASVDVVEVNRA